jgi:hypothetical protein
MKCEETWAQVRGYTSLKVQTHNERREMYTHLTNSGFKIVWVEGIISTKNFFIHFEKQLS